ncbi:MAG TPA: EAL domain-containing protein [Burkholderiaceae bacterium]|nr:EAL domain-containing protein [Burkholderiaceae bacterium]
MAFQPLVDARARRVIGHEALVRGPAGEPAHSVLSRVDDGNRYLFDQAARRRAIELAAGLRAPGLLSINFMPNAVYRPETCIRATLEAAARTGFPTERIVFEVTEGERVADRAHLVAIFREYRRRGLLTAIDDFGAGWSGLDLLADFQPDIVKLDMALVRGIEGDRVRRAIVDSVARLCVSLGIRVLAEGVETAAESAALLDLGLDLQQGYLFARPAFETLPAPDFEAAAVA